MLCKKIAYQARIVKWYLIWESNSGRETGVLVSLSWWSQRMLLLSGGSSLNAGRYSRWTTVTDSSSESQRASWILLPHRHHLEVMRQMLVEWRFLLRHRHVTSNVFETKCTNPTIFKYSVGIMTLLHFVLILHEFQTTLWYYYYFLPTISRHTLLYKS